MCGEVELEKAKQNPELTNLQLSQGQGPSSDLSSVLGDVFCNRKESQITLGDLGFSSVSDDYLTLDPKFPVQ